jgi:hypothetical protein
MIGKKHALPTDAINVGCGHHHAVAIEPDIRRANVISHDDQDIGLLRPSGCRGNKRRTDGCRDLSDSALLHVEAPSELLNAKHQIGALIPNHHGGGIGVSTNEIGHNRGVYYA